MTMDFSKIKPAVEDISLTDEQMEQIISNCKGKKRKFNYKPLVIAAAAAVVIVVIASPGFLFRAKEADKAVAENANQKYPVEDYHYVADEEYHDAYSDNYSGSGAPNDICIFADLTAFETEEFTELYTLIPAEFLYLSGDEDLSGWLAEISANDGMAIMQFVIRFNVSKENFDRANIGFAARTGNSFDADAIYTFDKELVDSIYRK